MEFDKKGKAKFKKEWNETCKMLKEKSEKSGIDLKKIKLTCKDKFAEYSFM